MNCSLIRLKTLTKENISHRFWYVSARKSIKNLSKQYNIPYNKLCGVVAILSQNIRLEFNQELVLDWIKNGANIKAVNKIRHYNTVKNNLKHYLKYNEIRGPKISAFYEVLVGNNNAIVLDTHMASAFFINKQWNNTKRKKATKVITKIAKEFNWKPAHVQAAIWCGIYRDKFPNKPIANYSF